MPAAVESAGDIDRQSESQAVGESCCSQHHPVEQPWARSRRNAKWVLKITASYGQEKRLWVSIEIYVSPWHRLSLTHHISFKPFRKNKKRRTRGIRKFPDFFRMGTFIDSTHGKP